MKAVNLEELLPADFIERRKKEYSNEELKDNRDVYWDFLGELMFFGGFDAVRAVLDDYLEIEQANALLKSVRRVYYENLCDISYVNLAANKGIYKPAAYKEMLSLFEKKANS